MSLLSKNRGKKGLKIYFPVSQVYKPDNVGDPSTTDFAWTPYYFCTALLARTNKSVPVV